MIQNKRQLVIWLLGFAVGLLISFVVFYSPPKKTSPQTSIDPRTGKPWQKGHGEVFKADGKVYLFGDTAAMITHLYEQSIKWSKPVVLVQAGDTTNYFPGDTIRLQPCTQSGYASNAE